MNDSAGGETVPASKKLFLLSDYIQRNIKQRKANLVRRHIRIAEQCLDAAGEEKFQLRQNSYVAQIKYTKFIRINLHFVFSEVTLSVSLRYQIRVKQWFGRLSKCNVRNKYET